MSQAELARRSGCGQPTISKLEWADHRAQSGTVLRLAEALGTLPSELLREPLKME
jgi:transcriptional regulator with XRE-family HTH domain